MLTASLDGFSVSVLRGGGPRDRDKCGDGRGKQREKRRWLRRLDWERGGIHDVEGGGERHDKTTRPARDGKTRRQHGLAPLPHTHTHTHHAHDNTLVCARTQTALEAPLVHLQSFNTLVPRSMLTFTRRRERTLDRAAISSLLSPASLVGVSSENPRCRPTFFRPRTKSENESRKAC